MIANILMDASLMGCIEDAIVPIFICVVLPVMCVWLSTRARRHEIDRKTELAMKAIENGVEIDPKIFCAKKKSYKEKSFVYLLRALVLMAIGVAFIIMGVLMRDTAGDDGMTGMLCTAVIFLCLGIVFFVVYFLYRAQFADEISSEGPGAKKD